MAAAKPLGDETAKKVIRQVEFYFSDSNLPRDAFLTKTIGESDDGMVNLSLICSFSRMRGHLGLGDVKPENVSDDTINAVAEALRASSFLKISEDGKRVGRVAELPEPEKIIEQLDGRTIAASPLEYDVKLEDVEHFFQQYAKVNSVRLPRHIADNKLFCGTALIEFATDEDAENILKQTLCYSGAELELKTKKDFDAERAKQEETVVKTQTRTGSNGKYHVNSEPDYPKGLIVSFKLKSILAGDSMGQNENAMDGEKMELEMTKEEGKVQVSKDTEKSSDLPNEKEEQGSNERRSMLETYKDNQNVVLMEDLKSIFQNFGSVKYVDFKIGSDSGYVRFEEPEAAQKSRAAAVLSEKGGLIVKNFIATLEPVTGDTEKEYWNLLRCNQGRHRDSYKSKSGRGGRHNRGRHFGGKHSRSRDDSKDHPNKIQKV